jgi:Protein of unknown function (DUF3592)
MAAYPLRAALAGVLLFVIGLAIAGGTLEVNWRERDQLRGWLRADGTIVELLKRRTMNGEILVPLIAFNTASGDRVSFTLSEPGRDSPYYVNAPVKILYHPDHPQDALIDTRTRRWTRNALASGGALILLALGGYVAWYASRWENKIV